ncbi:MAG: hypothetical protein U0R70_02135 [Solirubrobacteraceae bacterium]
MTLVRYLDLVVLALALPVFIAADLPLVGYAAGGGAWLLQRGIQAWTNRRAVESADTRSTVGIIAGSMIGRGWLVAIIVFVTGITQGDKAGLAAAVLVVLLFTVYFTVNMIFRPFDAADARERKAAS